MAHDDRQPPETAATQPAATEPSMSPGGLLTQSDLLAAAGDWGGAAEEVNLRLLEADPERSVAMTRLARCLLNRGEATAAEALYLRLVAVDPANRIANNFLRRADAARQKYLADEKLAAQAARKQRAVVKRGSASS